MHRAADRLADDPELAAVAEWMRDGARGDLLEYLGAESTRGHSARRELALASRNAEFREAARLFGADAEMLTKRLHRYHAGQWRHDRQKSVCPHPPRAFHAFLWRALKAVDHPIGRRQMQRIIGDVT